MVLIQLGHDFIMAETLPLCQRKSDMAVSNSRSPMRRRLRLIDREGDAAGLVAVGGGEDARVWTSVDGITWPRVAHDESIFGGADDQWMQSVTVGGAGLIAVWSQRSNSPFNSRGSEVDAAVWIGTVQD